jgi:hypothetical protein
MATKRSPITPTVETIQQNGTFDAEELERRLAGKAHLPEVQAIISILELHMSRAGEESEVRGQDATVRTEACGAKRWLRETRAFINELLCLRPDEVRKAG